MGLGGQPLFSGLRASPTKGDKGGHLIKKWAYCLNIVQLSGFLTFMACIFCSFLSLSHWWKMPDYWGKVRPAIRFDSVIFWRLRARARVRDLYIGFR